MNCTHRIVATVALISLPSNPTPKTLVSPNFNRLLSVSSANRISNKRSGLQIKASVSDSSGAGSWVNRLPTAVFSADKVLRLISGATSSPIGQYVSSPSTFLHSVDPRIKLVCFIFFGCLLGFVIGIRFLCKFKKNVL